VNEFEKNAQSQNNDIVDSIRGFLYSTVFFLVIFFIGTIFEVVGR
jgi:hypothetical protein